MNVIKNFLNSEKGVFAYLLPMIGLTVLALAGHLTAKEWAEYAMYFSGIYTGGKAIQGAGAAMGKNQDATNATIAQAVSGAIQQMTEQVKGNDAAADKALADKFGEVEGG